MDAPYSWIKSLGWGPLGTLVSNGVKVADKGKMLKIIKFDKIGLKLLLDIGLEVLHPNLVQS